MPEQLNRQRPAVTVLMAVYNAERFLADAITSILKQTFSDFELLIIDDGSTDQTADVVRQFSDSRIQFMLAGQRLGLPGALNLGLENASGDLVARHDHDDISDPLRLEQQVACHLGKLEAVVAHPHHHAAPLLRVKAHEAKVQAKDALDGDKRGGGGEDEPG